MSIESLVSIIGSGYFQAVSDLIDRLLKQSPTRRDPVGALYYDNVYSTAIILLTVAALESYVTRLRYFKGVSQSTRYLSVPEYIRHVFPGFRLVKAVTDVFVVRDAIFHNHLWKIDFNWRPRRVTNATLVSHREDRKYRATVNMKTRRTRTLRLHVVPTRVDRRDALKVIDTVWKALLFLERQGRQFCYVSDDHVQFRHQMKLFCEVRDVLAAGI
jgi:hypothetical protein